MPYYIVTTPKTAGSMKRYARWCVSERFWRLTPKSIATKYLRKREAEQKMAQVKRELPNYEFSLEKEETRGERLRVPKKKPQKGKT